MNREAKKTRRYITIYAIIGIIAILSLWVNIKTNALMIESQRLKLALKELREKNNQLEHRFLRQTNMETIDQKATETLKMAPPKAIIFIKG